ncbi:hypothetical protein [Clostridium sp. VAP52]|uniref:hypothetical protein n=1 Tax=Clostridium sp. VAP52 TaxID=2949977 RepID=UPI002079A8FE|nr:hypothetical protein [Clostridium sp. VAP52]
MNEKEYLDYIEEWKKQNKDLIDSGTCRKVFLECLPRKKADKRSKGMAIDWHQSENKKVQFIFNHIEGVLTIIKFEAHPKLIIKYKEELIDVSTRTLIESRLSYVLKVKNKCFMYNINDVIHGKYSDIKIINRERVKVKRKDKRVGYRKIYKYKCLNCNNINNIGETKLKHNKGCKLCCDCSKKVVRGINDIATTHPHLVKYFKIIEDTYTHTYSSNKKVKVKCPDCGFEKEMIIGNLYKRGFLCNKCGNKISYPEKLMFLILEQLGLNFKTQLTKTDFNWCNNYRYDFYFEHNNEKYIIETHGLQHYKENTNFRMNLKEVQKNDKFKKELAIKNGIKEENYIVIDCRKSELKFIKQNILNSRLNEIFDLSKIDWVQVKIESLNSILYKCSKLWNEGMSMNKISKKLKLKNQTIRKYLKIGYKYNLNNYCDKNKIICIETKQEFNSASECARISQQVFGFKMNQPGISNSCRTKTPYKGFIFIKKIDYLTLQLSQSHPSIKL